MCVCVCVCVREREREREKERMGRVGMPAPKRRSFSWIGITSSGLNGDSCHTSLIKINVNFLASHRRAF